MNSFNEENWQAEEILNFVETMLFGIERMYKINYRKPPHDIARKFLNEIHEFVPLREVDKI